MLLKAKSLHPVSYPQRSILADAQANATRHARNGRLYQSSKLAIALLIGFALGIVYMFAACSYLS